MAVDQEQVFSQHLGDKLQMPSAIKWKKETEKIMNSIKPFISVTLVSLLTACTSVGDITMKENAIEKISTGMSEQEVIALLGDPGGAFQQTPEIKTLNYCSTGLISDTYYSVVLKNSLVARVESKPGQYVDGSCGLAYNQGYRLDINASVRTPKPIRNPKCADIQKYRIFQVIDDGALAFACDSQYGNELCSGMVAYIPKMIDSNYYDELIVEPVGGQCISYEGVYKYSTKDGYNKTVPILKFITEQ